MSVTSSDLLGATVGATTQLNSLGASVGTIDIDQLPEEYKGLTPTVKVLLKCLDSSLLNKSLAFPISFTLLLLSSIL